MIYVEITDEYTGEVGGTLMTDEFSDFMWRDGNFSCDCNRGQLFGNDDSECGDDRYSVRVYVVNPNPVYEDARPAIKKPRERG